MVGGHAEALIASVARRQGLSHAALNALAVIEGTGAPMTAGATRRDRHRAGRFGASGPSSHAPQPEALIRGPLMSTTSTSDHIMEVGMGSSPPGFCSTQSKLELFTVLGDASLTASDTTVPVVCGSVAPIPGNRGHPTAREAWHHAAQRYEAKGRR